MHTSCAYTSALYTSSIFHAHAYKICRVAFRCTLARSSLNLAVPYQSCDMQQNCVHIKKFEIPCLSTNQLDHPNIYKLFTMLGIESNSLYSTSLLLLGWLLQCTSMLRPRLLTILTAAAMYIKTHNLFNQLYRVHIMPLVINSLVVDMHMHTNRQSNSKEPGVLACSQCVPGLTSICEWILVNQPNCHTGPIPFYWPS